MFANTDTDAENLQKIISLQEQTLSTHRGRGIDVAVVELAAQRLNKAPIHPDFVKYQQAEFLYEKLDGEADGEKFNGSVEKVNDTLLKLVELWENNPDNIQRASAAVGREPSQSKSPVVKAFCGFRFKELSKAWGQVRGLAIDERERSTVVIMALQNLSYENGSFVELAAGEDVCLDGNATVCTPGTGGGLGIFIDLNI